MMSDKKITLPDFIIADLYTNNLVIGNDLHITEAASVLPEIQSAPIVSVAENFISEPILKKPATKNDNKQVEKTIPVVPDFVDQKPKWFLGNNGKNITILIKEKDVAFITEPHLEFLSNILNACKLNLGDIALVNHINHPYLYSDLKSSLQPNYLILFDVSTKEIQLPFTIPNYQVQRYDQSQILLAPSLSKMDDGSQEAKIEKSKLWVSLKTMFQL